MGSLGDVVRGLAVAQRLKSNFPYCRITWLVEPRCKDIVRGHAAIDRVVVFERQNFPWSIAKLCSELWNESYDICIDLQRHLKSGFFSWLSRASRRIGFHPKDAKELNWLFNTEYVARPASSASKLDHYLKFTELLGAKSGEVDFGLSTTSLSLTDFELPERYLAVVMGSRWASKNWTQEGYFRLCKQAIQEFGLSVVLLGDDSQRDDAQQILKQLDSQRCQSLVGRTSLKSLISVIKSAQACVGPDSGPGHLAAALKTPYITLFGPTDPARVAPHGFEGLVLRSQVGCSPCNQRVCPGLNRVCMRLISADAVISKLREVLAPASKGLEQRAF